MKPPQNGMMVTAFRGRPPLLLAEENTYVVIPKGCDFFAPFLYVVILSAAKNLSSV
jgi:hypothetical protein